MDNATDARRFTHESAAVAVAPVLRVGAILLFGALLLAAVVYMVIDHRHSPERNAHTAVPEKIPVPQLQPWPTLDRQRFDAQQAVKMQTRAVDGGER
jgi:hypothetical protein